MEKESIFKKKDGKEQYESTKHDETNDKNGKIRKNDEKYR
jgi:hypothetical protein|tara:strand:- start:185 stop:304 length:120 start_codon:yes stop_codon:yes gene_type:complete